MEGKTKIAPTFASTHLVPFAPANPFIASAADQGYGINAPGGSDFDPNQPYTYELLKSGPAVRPEDVESLDAAIEVLVKWDSNTLHVSHSSPPKSFFVGEAKSHVVHKKQLGCDYYIPKEILGTDRAPIVVARGMTAVLIMLPRSIGTVEIPDQGTFTFQDLIASGRAKSSSELSGSHEFELPHNAKARIALHDSSLVFEVSAVNAGKVLDASPSFDPASILFSGLSFLFHAGVLASMAFFMPKMSGDDSDLLDRGQLDTARKLLDASAMREQAEKAAEQGANGANGANDNGDQGGGGQRAPGEEGAMGNPNSTRTNGRWGVRGPADNLDPHLARERELQKVREGGLIGILTSGGGGDPKAPTSPWGRDDSSGYDPLSANGQMFGTTIEDAFGPGGLDLTGPGIGGGGTSGIIGLGGPDSSLFGHDVGRDHNLGGPPGSRGNGVPFSHGRPPGVHTPKALPMRTGPITVNGRLPPEVIQRIVRQNFGRFRLCYENGLRNNPSLSGRVAVRFVVDRSGAVSTTQDGGSQLPDQGVVSCVVRAFGNLSFPQPEGGIVTVIYPITFTPGE
ncbi:MAG: AgmX/PglI C-terminal domain-containing protein [Polyangiaceae bacterium]|nr:AgmX/PglI C-terminal domain-containing protein [Polyangiaceae bacterium]